MTEIQKAAQDISDAGLRNSESVRDLQALVDKFTTSTAGIHEKAAFVTNLGIAVKKRATILARKAKKE